MEDYLVDTHCHLHDQEWYTPAQAEEILAEAQACGVRQVIVIGTDPEDSVQAQIFAAQHPNAYWTYGIHPESAGRVAHVEETLVAFSEKYQRELKALQGNAENTGPNNLISTNKLVAIGEIGLDYHYEGYDRAAQIKLFEQMLQLAQDLGLPVSLHIREREAFADAWPILDNFPAVKGVVHSFTGSKQELRRALERDFYIGVNGLATYSTLPLPPLEKMLLETDAPFLTPVPFRGTMNKSGYIREIATYLSEKLGVAEVNIAEQTTKNARQLFQLGDPII